MFVGIQKFFVVVREMGIKEDTSMNEKSKWIKCEERLPELTLMDTYSDDVLVAVKWNDGDVTYDVGWYHKNGKWNVDCDSRKVVAWQPIQEPFVE